MTNRKDTTIVLGSKRYKTAINTDLSLVVPLDNTQKEIEEFDRSSVLSLSQVFDDERQESTVFRPTAEIDFMFYNVYSGTTFLGATNEYKPFTNNLYYVNLLGSFGNTSYSGFPQYNEFDLIRTDNNISGYTTNSGTTDPHIWFVNKSASTYNWTQYLSYAYRNDSLKKLKYYYPDGSIVNWKSGDGIPFYIQNPYIDNGQDLISFICPVEHGLSVGEYVELNIPGWNGYNGQKVFQVYSLGQSGYNSDKYIFNIFNYGFYFGNFNNSSKGTFKRIIDITNSAETKSRYYVRKHRILTNVDDAILTNAAFELNAFGTERQYEFSSLTPDKQARITQREGNQSYLLSFSKDMDFRRYRDNLKRPITEIYFTFINKGYFGWFNKPIDSTIINGPSLKEGFGFNISTTVSPYWSNLNADNRTNIETRKYVKLLGGNNYTFYYNKDLKSGDTINGPLCEFNQFEQKERVISDIYHKFVFNDKLFVESAVAEQGPSKLLNQDGYYYKVHHPITLRVYSDYLEEADVKYADQVPDYAFYSRYYKTLRWRDIYTYGFVESNGLGVDYPFLNGCHYPSTKIIFRVFPEGNVPQNIYSIADPIIDGCE